MRAVLLLLVLASCSGPCKETEAARLALMARKGVAPGPHARIQLPYELANHLIAEVVKHEPELPVTFDELGPFAPYLPKLHARILTIELGLAPPGLVHFDARIAVSDDSGELMTFVAQTEVKPTLDGHTLVIALRGDSISSVKPELGATSRQRLGDEIVRRLPDAVRDHVPRLVVDHVAAKLVEQGAQQTYRLLRAALLGRLGELTAIRIALPDLPIARVDVASTQGPVPALALGVVSTLPIRAAVREPAVDPVATEVAVAISGSAAAELANWGVANGMLPPRYTRGLKPAPDGTYVPYFDWRTEQPDRPLVVHMFKVEDGCAHFAVGVLPHVEVTNGSLRTWVENKSLEQADASFAFEMLARIHSAFESSTSDANKLPGHVHVTIGGRDVSGSLTRAAIVDNELRLGVALDIHDAI